MNERIRELAEQAIESTGVEGLGGEYRELNPEKFAELVAAAEREAIVKLVWNTPQADDEYVCHKDTITKAIRARGGDA